MGDVRVEPISNMPDNIPVTPLLGIDVSSPVRMTLIVMSVALLVVLVATVLLLRK